MIVKTQSEISRMILALKHMRTRLPNFNIFGADNYSAIDAQIHVLENNLTDTQIDVLYDDSVDDRLSAQDAFEWRIGNIESIVDDEDWDAVGTAIDTEDIVCKRVCKECPFSKNSLQGWLANYSVDDIANFINAEALFPCHLMMPEGDLNQEQVQEYIKSGKMKLCRGYVESVIKSAKVPRNNKPLIEAFNRVKEQGVCNETMSIWEFKKHHSK